MIAPRIIVLARDHAQAKTRLARCLDTAARASLAHAMLDDLLGAIAAARTGWEVTVATDSGSIAGRVGILGARAMHLRTSGPRATAAAALAAALCDGCPAALVLPADLPLARPEDIVAVITAGEPPAELVVVPDRHEDGTNALLLCPPDRLSPLFGVGSYNAHLAAARRAGLRVRVIAPTRLIFDIDNPEDLMLLRSQAASAGPHTRELLTLLAERDLRRPAVRYGDPAC